MLTDFYNQIIAEPVNVLAQSLAGMLAQVTAGMALSGIGKRGISDFFNQLGQQLIDATYPIINQGVQSKILRLFYHYFKVFKPILFFIRYCPSNNSSIRLIFFAIYFIDKIKKYKMIFSQLTLLLENVKL